MLRHTRALASRVLPRTGGPAHRNAFRAFSSAAINESAAISPAFFAIAAGAAAVGGLFLLNKQQQNTGVVYNAAAPNTSAAKVDYQAVYNDIAAILEDEKWDDGSWGPVLIRLAWHQSGTYCQFSHTGGSNGCLIRHAPEAQWGANAGLQHARAFLEKVKQKHPNISYADLYTLAGVVAVQEMGGPTIPWRPGRTDAPNGSSSPADGRLPDASKGGDHLRCIFYRMGFGDREIVALSGAHVVGRCHTDRSGYTGPWSFSPITFSNEYFKLMLSEEWQEKKWKGPKQYEDKKTQSLMMLPADLELRNDAKFAKYVQLYAENEQIFFDDFAAAFGKLLELGCGFNNESQAPMRFKPT